MRTKQKAMQNHIKKMQLLFEEAGEVLRMPHLDQLETLFFKKTNRAAELISSVSFVTLQFHDFLGGNSIIRVAGRLRPRANSPRILAFILRKRRGRHFGGWQNRFGRV